MTLVTRAPFRVLVLDDDPHTLDGIAELLGSAGYQVSAVATYQEAKQHLADAEFDLLVTDVRLRGFNGLHLIMQCRRESPDIALMIMSGDDESLLEIEAGRYNAHFVRKPLKPAHFLEDVSKAVGRVRRRRRWPRKQVAGGFRVIAAGRPAAVTEIGYGGLRLEIPDADSVPTSFDVEVAGIGLHLEVHPVWSSSSTNNALICGAALTSDSTPAARTWRTIVDRLT